MKPETRAQRVLETYGREVGDPDAIPLPARLVELIAAAIQKAVIDDHDALRAMMPCAPADPCGIDQVCAHHKALLAALMSVQEGTPRP
jgi:hypothetical protein